MINTNKIPLSKLRNGNKILNQFIKQFKTNHFFDDSKDDFKECLVGFHTNLEYSNTLLNIIKKVDVGHYNRKIVWDINSSNIFDEAVRFVLWYNKWCKRSIRDAVKKGVKDGSIYIEEQARQLAKSFLSDEVEDFVVTLHISNYLPKRMKYLYREERFDHPFFDGKVRSIIFEDVYGRVWSKSTGTIRAGSKTCLLNRSEEHTSELQSLVKISYAVFCLKKWKWGAVLVV